MIAIILSAFPLYGLALLCSAYWLDSSIKLFLSVNDLSFFLKIEGAVLFVALFVTGVIASGDTRGNIKRLSLTFLIVGAASIGYFLQGGAILLFWILIISHLLGVINSTGADRSRIGLAIFASLPAYALTGYLTSYSTLPWGTFYFSVAGTAHLLSGLMKFPEDWDEEKR